MNNNPIEGAFDQTVSITLNRTLFANEQEVMVRVRWENARGVYPIKLAV